MENNICVKCRIGAVKCYNVNFDLAIFACNNINCDSLFEKLPSESIVYRKIICPKFKVKGKDVLWSDSSGIQSDASSISYSTATITDSDTQPLLKNRNRPQNLNEATRQLSHSYICDWLSSFEFKESFTSMVQEGEIVKNNAGFTDENLSLDNHISSISSPVKDFHQNFNFTDFDNITEDLVLDKRTDCEGTNINVHFSGESETSGKLDFPQNLRQNDKIDDGFRGICNSSVVLSSSEAHSCSEISTNSLKRKDCLDEIGETGVFEFQDTSHKKLLNAIPGDNQGTYFFDEGIHRTNTSSLKTLAYKEKLESLSENIAPSLEQLLSIESDNVINDYPNFSDSNSTADENSELRSCCTLDSQHSSISLNSSHQVNNASFAVNSEVNEYNAPPSSAILQSSETNISTSQVCQQNIQHGSVVDYNTKSPESEESVLYLTSQLSCAANSNIAEVNASPSSPMHLHGSESDISVFQDGSRNSRNETVVNNCGKSPESEESVLFLKSVDKEPNSFSQNDFIDDQNDALTRQHCRQYSSLHSSETINLSSSSPRRLGSKGIRIDPWSLPELSLSEVSVEVVYQNKVQVESSEAKDICKIHKTNDRLYRVPKTRPINLIKSNSFSKLRKRRNFNVVSNKSNRKLGAQSTNAVPVQEVHFDAHEPFEVISNSNIGNQVSRKSRLDYGLAEEIPTARKDTGGNDRPNMSYYSPLALTPEIVEISQLLNFSQPQSTKGNCERKWHSVNANLCQHSNVVDASSSRTSYFNSLVSDLKFDDDFVWVSNLDDAGQKERAVGSNLFDSDYFNIYDDSSSSIAGQTQFHSYNPSQAFTENQSFDCVKEKLNYKNRLDSNNFGMIPNSGMSKTSAPIENDLDSSFINSNEKNMVVYDCDSNVKDDALDELIHSSPVEFNDNLNNQRSGVNIFPRFEENSEKCIAGKEISKSELQDFPSKEISISEQLSSQSWNASRSFHDISCITLPRSRVVSCDSTLSYCDMRVSDNFGNLKEDVERFQDGLHHSNNYYNTPNYFNIDNSEVFSKKDSRLISTKTCRTATENESKVSNRNSDFRNRLKFHTVEDMLNLLRESGWAVTPCDPHINYNHSSGLKSPTIVPLPLKDQYGLMGSDTVIWTRDNDPPVSSSSPPL